MTPIYYQIILTNIISIALLICGIILSKNNNNNNNKTSNKEKEIPKGVIDNSFKFNIHLDINIGFFLIILAVSLQVFILSKFTYIDILQKSNRLDNVTSSKNNTNKNTSDINNTDKNNTIILKSNHKDKNGSK